ncbi:hypothetical protein F4810DRAFT_696409 [Camillea tinctor]|nr:hypothetical protein F4810DRAFT_696409 [Camillea tinctor]
MALYVVYLYGHVNLLKNREFANHINYENSQFHRDAVAGLRVGTLPVIAEERRLRDQLRG